jgi:hypothetical protein
VAETESCDDIIDLDEWFECENSKRVEAPPPPPPPPGPVSLPALFPQYFGCVCVCACMFAKVCTGSTDSLACMMIAGSCDDIVDLDAWFACENALRGGEERR